MSFVFIYIYKSERETIKTFDLPNNYETIFFEEYDSEYSTFLDTFGYSDDGFIVSRGWAMKVGDSNLESYANLTFLLKNEQNIYFKVKTVVENRPDVTEVFSDGTNYNNSGFLARGSVKKLSEGDYQACLLYIEKDGTSHLFLYDQYINVR